MTMLIMKPRQSLIRLVDNALDFLSRALSELERSPKYSLIHFHAAVELLLKARLLAEHWTLVIAKRQDADLKRFLAGDFQSVSLEEAADRLDKVIQSPLSPSELALFRNLAKHRNRMMHFHHEVADAKAATKLKKEVVIEQLRAWYVLNKLLLERWGDVFKNWRASFEQVSERLRGNRQYLQVSFEAVGPQLRELEARGIAIENCPACGFLASQVHEMVGLVKSCACAVCQLKSAQVIVPCPNCKEPLQFVGDGFTECNSCREHVTPQNLAEILDEDEQGTKDYYESGMPAHCTHCSGYETVVHHGGECVCASCFMVFREHEMHPCSYCGALNAGELEDSYAVGCVVCSGSMRSVDD